MVIPGRPGTSGQWSPVISMCMCGEVLLRGGPGVTAAVRSRLVILMLIARPGPGPAQCKCQWMLELETNLREV